MRIAMLLHSGVGGSGVVATELGLRLAARGHEVHLIANAVPFRLADERHDNVFFHQIGSMTYPLFDAPLTTLAEASKVVEVVEQYGIDVIHAHYAIPHAAAALIARAMVRTRPIPAIVTTLHGTDVTLVGLDAAYLRATQWSIESSDAVSAVSRYLADTTINDMGVRRDTIHVVYNAVDTMRFRPGNDPSLRSRYASDSEHLLVHVSNFRPVKRIEDVIRMFALVHAELPARLLMIGDGPDRPRAVAVAESLDVLDRVRFLGSFPRIERLLACADLFVLPSSKESFGLSALEAMASGVPVIASNIGGLSEVIEHGVSGFLHDVGDTAAMASSALELLHDRHRMAAFRHAARHRAMHVFDPTANVGAYLDLYERALGHVRPDG
ncbi:MAG: N-acetyl-alpha-D-glucosaminyl L-malate synthase BshA [Trueperaceae bacterium]|nr:MAG: N-acetyl-alpha-D-glucosaminyl L-malate synthase BshA [Trueperaceae bacterium]